ncbi:hypothetical protein L2E82_12311 [Cichorium intybus]|uniref:Uncharacterized protein n=1 Tax=Cichorium intybus TaxID=13427 RepID=A0ACB9GGD8_CICIN|nr:hypothetical protein L2E82_12311 [Cichorium intybus]
MSNGGSPYRRRPKNLESGGGGGGGGGFQEDHGSVCDPFDFVSIKSASVDRLKRWRVRSNMADMDLALNTRTDRVGENANSALNTRKDRVVENANSAHPGGWMFEDNFGKWVAFLGSYAIDSYLSLLLIVFIPHKIDWAGYAIQAVLLVVIFGFGIRGLIKAKSERPHTRIE